MNLDRKKVVWYLLLAANIILLFLTGLEYQKHLKLQESIAEKVIRFHVRANSDQSNDQELKLKVRDAVGKKMDSVLHNAENRAECEILIKEEMDAIEDAARAVVCQEGYGYDVSAHLAEVDFPAKKYGDYVFPAGRYEALEIVIGEGKGQNWWCVMYPNMCFSGSVYEVVDEKAEESLRAVLSKEEYEKVLSSGDYEVQFKCLSFLNRLRF